MSAGAVPSNEYLIETVVLGANAASVTFNNLSQYAGVYRHLQIVCVTKYSNFGFVDNVFLRLSGDTGANYSHHRLLGNGSTVTSIGSTSQTSAVIGMASSNVTSGVFAPLVIDLLDPFVTTKNKTLRSLYGDSQAPAIRFNSALHMSTAAVSSIQIFSPEFTFATGSRFSLYGVTA
jgi:hypothetical protein